GRGDTTVCWKPAFEPRRLVAYKATPSTRLRATATVQTMKVRMPPVCVQYPPTWWQADVKSMSRHPLGGLTRTWQRIEVTPRQAGDMTGETSVCYRTWRTEL